jgi:(p)ppGpp synthase/HD superfamily hydrolase
MPVRAAPGAQSEAAAHGPPDFARDSELLREAYAMALDAHHGARRRGETDIDHPVSVAEVLFDYGITDEEVLAAAFLHDVVEDTATDPEEIGERFGARVRALVEEMTEDAEIESYAERKAEHRHRVTRDRHAAAIYAADKLARSRDLRMTPQDASPERVEHFLETLELLCRTHPNLPFLVELRQELEILRERTGDAG